MSYILDALKKSERDRARGAIPSLTTPPQGRIDRVSLWMGVGIAAGVLICLAAAAWFVSAQWLRPAPGPAPGPAVQTAPSGKAVEQADTAPAPAPEQQSAAASADASRTAGTPEAKAAARMEGLSLDAISYSEVPGRSFVMLNQRIVRESQTVVDGVVVKQIFPRKVVLSVDDREVVLRAE